jgi:hypothetical protein
VWEYCTVVARWDKGEPLIWTSSELDEELSRRSIPLIQGLQRLGRQGWELVAVDSSSQDHKAVYVFKRRVQAPEAPATLDVASTL